MIIIMLGAAAIVPGLMLMWFFHAADVHKEPPRVLWASFGLGVLTIPLVLLSVWPVVALSGIEQIGNPYLRGTLDAFFEAAIPEEAWKLAVVLAYAYRHREFDEPMDGIVYATAASLGFATLENVLYVGSGGMGVAILRAVTAVPGHAMTGVFMGYFLGQAKFNPERRGSLLAKAFFVPTILHGIYDTPLLIMKAFDELDVKPTSTDQTIQLVMLLGWVIFFITEVIWGLRVASRLRQAQLTDLVRQGQPVAGWVSPHSVRHAAPVAPQPSRAKGWLQIVVGVILASIGGLLSLGMFLVLATNAKGDETLAMVIVLIVVGLIPLGLGMLAFYFGVKNLSVSGTPKAATYMPHG